MMCCLVIWVVRFTILHQQIYKSFWSKTSRVGGCRASAHQEVLRDIPSVTTTGLRSEHYWSECGAVLVDSPHHYCSE